MWWPNALPVTHHNPMDAFLKHRLHPSSTQQFSLLHSLPLHASFDYGYHLTIRAIQELRDKKESSVSVGIGGPPGSGKSSLANKIATVFGAMVVAMENYHYPPLAADDSSDLDMVDFSLLTENLEALLNGKDAMGPQFDFQEKKRSGYKLLKAPASHVIIVEGTYALHSKLRSFLDIRVAVVGGIHFSLLSKVRRETGESLSLDYLIDSIFPMYRRHIEPDLRHAQIKISNSFKSSLREPSYILKMEKELLKKPIEPLLNSSKVRHEESIETYLRPPFATDHGKTSGWMKMQQCGIRYYLTWCDQRIVDKNFIIKPKVEFEVGKTTLVGLLALGYQVAASYKRESSLIDDGAISICVENIVELEKTFVLVQGMSRKVVATGASSVGLEGPWITKSYLEMVLDRKGLDSMDSPPLLPPILLSNVDKGIVSSQTVRLLPPVRLPDALEPWTWSPTKSGLEPPTASWSVTTLDATAGIHLAYSTDVLRAKVQLVPIPEVFDFDGGLLLAVQGIQTLLNAKGPPILVGIGGPSGSGKTSLARKMSNIVGCEVISMENYYKSEQAKDFKYDDFASLDLELLLKNVEDIRAFCPTKVPMFDFEKNFRTGYKELEVSEDCGLVIIEGVYALHPNIRKYLDIWIAVIGGVHSHLVARVQRDLESTGRLMSPQEVMRTIFPMFQQHIEPHLVHAHLKIRNDFDPVHSSESSMFVLKSDKEVAFQEIMRVLHQDRITSTIQRFTDIYLCLSGLPSNGVYTECNCIRVRHCEGRFALLIREPIREGNFLVQPKVDFDISVRTVAGLLNLGYQAVAYIEATATIYQDDKLLIEVDHLKNIDSPFIQIKGTNKEDVLVAASVLHLDGNYITMSNFEIVLGKKLAHGQGFIGLHDQEAARLQEWVDLVQSQGANSGSEDTVSPTVTTEYLVEELQIRVKRLERWQMLNTVLWTFFMSAFVGYILYHKTRRSHF